MTEPNPSKPADAPADSKRSFAAEDQRHRWMKYGANVVFSVIIVAALVVLLCYVFEAHAKRIDTTIGGSQSLRPQTIQFVKDLKTPVHIVALYPKVKNTHDQDYYQPVADLLTDFASKSNQVTVQVLDPTTDRDGFDKLLQDITNRFGGEVKDYKALLADIPVQNELVTKAIDAETKQLGDVLRTNADKITNPQGGQLLSEVYTTIASISDEFSQLKDTMSYDLGQQVPDYKDAEENAKNAYQDTSDKIDAIISNVFNDPNAQATIPKEVDAYMPGAIERLTATKKIVTGILDRINHLGQLTQLDEFKRAIKSQSIVVESDTGFRILSFDDVWKTPEASRFALPSNEKPRMVFSGEQAITSAIAALTVANKPMVVVVGPNVDQLVANPEYLGPLVERLREANFDVRTKDSSTMPQPSQQPDLTDQQLKDAIWLVMNVPDNPQAGQTTNTAAMLQQHLDQGGSALLLMYLNSNPMSDTLSQWGVTVNTNSIMVHDSPPADGRQSGDWLSTQISSDQLIFVMTNYGQHPLASPIQGLGLIAVAVSPVVPTRQVPAGIKVTPLLPVPTEPRSWEAADAQLATQMRESGQKITFNPKPDPNSGQLSADVENRPESPFYAAAAIEKTGAGRLVVVGSLQIALGTFLELPDPNQQNVKRFPGNAEFIMNSVYWLAKMDQMLAISPHALETSRIKEMSQGSQSFWRYGVLTAGMPLVVVLCGFLVYLRRRD